MDKEIRIGFGAPQFYLVFTTPSVFIRNNLTRAYNDIYNAFKDIKVDRHESPTVYWLIDSILNYIELFYQDNSIQINTEQDLLDEVYGFIKQSRRISGTRTETASGSKASANTKNYNRAIATTNTISRQASGDHADLVFMKNKTEIGCVEISLYDNGSNGTKELEEKTLKSPKMMKAFALQIIDSYPSVDISKLDIPGLIINGMFITSLKMKFNCGSVSLLSTSQRLKMPESIDEVPGLFPPVLNMVYNYAQTIKKTVKYIDDVSMSVPSSLSSDSGFPPCFVPVATANKKRKASDS